MCARLCKLKYELWQKDFKFRKSVPTRVDNKNVIMKIKWTGSVKDKDRSSRPLITLDVVRQYMKRLRVTTSHPDKNSSKTQSEYCYFEFYRLENSRLSVKQISLPHPNCQ